MTKIHDTVRKVVISQKLNKYIDLNTDFGQTADRTFFEGKERSLLHYVSSVNIPCCVHDSDPAQVLKDIKTAKINNCALGAHIAYPDPGHFGYTPMDIKMDDLFAWVTLQLGAFLALCRTNDTEFSHIRPHGALYSRFLSDEETAITVAKAIYKFDQWTTLIVPMGSIAAKIQAEVNIPVAEELYLGKRISAEGTPILDRGSDNLNPHAVIEQVKQLLTGACVTTEDGKILPAKCKTMHLSPKIQGNMMIAERINAMLGQPVSLSLAAAGSSGWL